MTTGKAKHGNDSNRTAAYIIDLAFVFQFNCEIAAFFILKCIDRRTVYPLRAARCKAVQPEMS